MKIFRLSQVGEYGCWGSTDVKFFAQTRYVSLCIVGVTHSGQLSHPSTYLVQTASYNCLKISWKYFLMSVESIDIKS